MSSAVVALALAPLAFHLPAVPTAPASTRSRPVTALAEFSDLAFTLHATAMPPEFADAFTTAKESHPVHHTFSYYLMEAAGCYILGSGAATFLPRIAAALKGEEYSVPQHTIDNYLKAAPESKYGWHLADLRGPLPPLEELEQHPIGVHKGKKVLLCVPHEAIKYRDVEFSKDFTEHYGTEVYICYA